MGGLIDHRPTRAEMDAAPRYDAEWIRVLAFGSLIIHHAASAFKPWGTHLLLVWNGQPFLGATQIVQLVSVWGIPLLFFALGMELRCALDSSSWRQLAGDLASRVIVPLAFGTAALGPLSLAIAFRYYYGRAPYVPTPEHLWFLGNALIYVLLLLPILIWAKRRPSSWLIRGVERLVRAGPGLAVVLFAGSAVLVALLMNPMNYTSYAFRLHGFVLGFILFVLGFLLVSSGETGRRLAERLRFVALAAYCLLALVRLLGLWNPLSALLALESMAWIVAIWGFASRHLGRPSRTLRRLSSAVLPVYVLHLPVQVFVSSFLMPMGIHPLPKFLLLLVLTIIGSVGLCQVAKRICWIRPLLGMEWTCGRGRLRQWTVP